MGVMSEKHGLEAPTAHSEGTANALLFGLIQAVCAHSAMGEHMTLYTAPNSEHQVLYIP